VTAGTGLTGGGVSGAVSLFLDTAYTDGRYVNATGDTISGNLSVTGRVGAGGGGYSNVTIVARERLPAGTDDYLLWMEDTAQARKFSVTVAGDTYAAGGASFTTVTIRGGADVAEPFDIIDQHKVVPGHLVAIDAARPGELRLADAAYDRTVAGIVSGAGGVQPGMLLHQEGSEADGAVPVALTGRVYAWADADANGSIVPGDLLTTSPTAGHAMRATDRERSHGAVIGKAMTSVEKGRGLVLVLVSLQ